jgi:hypothetical protein
MFVVSWFDGFRVQGSSAFEEKRKKQRKLWKDRKRGHGPWNMISHALAVVN